MLWGLARTNSDNPPFESASIFICGSSSMLRFGRSVDVTPAVLRPPSIPCNLSGSCECPDLVFPAKIPTFRGGSEPRGVQRRPPERFYRPVLWPVRYRQCEDSACHHLFTER
jgi:hypothetical protein